jgi:hypothetical protein
MSKPIEANFWTEHLLKQDASLDFVKAGGSLVRFPIAENDKAHRSLVSALRSAKEQNQLAFFTVPSHACEIHRPDKVLSELASRWNTESYATAVIRNVWKELRYDASESILLSDASRATGQDPNPMFSRFNRNLRDLLGRGLNNQGERLTAADRRSIGIMWPVKRDNATSILRSMLAFSALAGWTGSILHFDIRFVTDHAKYDEINSPNTYTKQKRIALYQWLREIIDQTQHFSKTVIVVETGPTFIDQSQFGIGIGIYDALKNRIVDDVSLNDSAVANPCAIVVPISGDSYVR